MLFNNQYLVLIVLLLSFEQLFATEHIISVNEYINTYKDIAVAEMERTGIPASIKLGQGIMETEHGNSKLAKNSNNHFGIKCKKEWTGKKYQHKDDDLDANGKLIPSCFRVYDTPFDSYIDHSNFLLSRDRYAMLFQFENTDYQNWANGLKECGYATASHYATRLIEIIETYQLFNYDYLGNGVSIAAQNKREAIRAKRYELINLKDAPLLKARRPIIAPVSVNEIGEDVAAAVFGKSFFQIPKSTVFMNNGVKAGALADGQFLELAAKEYAISMKKLLKYNDLTPTQPIYRGQYLYLAPKKKTFEGKNYYKTVTGETLYIVAQKFGITLKSLHKLNPKLVGKTLEAGDLVKLNNHHMVIGTPVF